MIRPDRLHIEHAQTAWADLPALAPVRRVEPEQKPCRGWCSRQGRHDCGRRGCNTVADSQPAALYAAEMGDRVRKRVEPYAVGAALALLAILGAIALHLARVIA